MWAAIIREGDFLLKEDLRNPCRLPSLLILNSSTSGRQVSAILLAIGSSKPESPDSETRSNKMGGHPS
jgi:hypothetical protein